MLDRRSLLLAGSALAALQGDLAATQPARAAANTLVMGMGQEPRHFNGAIQSGTATAIPATQIFASPLRFDADWNPQPYLAKSWTVAPDALSVTLNLVETAMFHDGHPVTSEDVAFTIGVIKARHPFTTMLAPVETVETPDPHTAVIRLKHPHPALLLAMSPALMPILPKHIYGDGQDIMTHPANLKPVGCGPFRFVEYARGQYIRLERFDKFFAPKPPALDAVVIRIITDPTVMVLALERGEVHMAPLLAGVRNIDRAQKIASLTVTPQGYAGIGPITWLAFNCMRKPLDDARVRQAIAFAVDRRQVTRVLMSGKAAEAMTPIVPTSPFYSKDVQPYAPDLARANALLDEAGHTRGADGARFPLVIDYDPGDPEQGRNIAEFLRPALRKIGIAAEVRAVPDFPTWAERVANYDYDMTVDSVFNWGDPVIGVARTYLSGNIRKGVVWANMQGYRNARVDELLEGAAAEPDLARRHALYAEFQRIVVDEAPIHFLNVVPYYTAAHKGLADLPLSIWGAMSPLHELRWATPPA